MSWPLRSGKRSWTIVAPKVKQKMNPMLDRGTNGTPNNDSYSRLALRTKSAVPRPNRPNPRDIIGSPLLLLLSSIPVLFDFLARPTTTKYNIEFWKRQWPARRSWLGLLGRDIHPFIHYPPRNCLTSSAAATTTHHRPRPNSDRRRSIDSLSARKDSGIE